MNAYDFKGQTAVVTGGAQGIGYAVVQRLLAGGAKVALWDQSAEALQSAKESLSGQGEFATFQVDIANLKQVEAAADATDRTLGPISVLGNSAGHRRGERAGRELRAGRMEQGDQREAYRHLQRQPCAEC